PGRVRLGQARRGAGGGAVAERPCGQDDERAEADPRRRPQSSHRTCSVNGAVITCPPGLNCRKSRHVPATGRRVPMLRCPVVVALLASFGFPSTLTHPGVLLPQTCVWK